MDIIVRIRRFGGIGPIMVLEIAIMKLPQFAVWTNQIESQCVSIVIARRDVLEGLPVRAGRVEIDVIRK